MAMFHGNGEFHVTCQRAINFNESLTLKCEMFLSRIHLSDPTGVITHVCVVVMFGPNHRLC